VAAAASIERVQARRGLADVEKRASALKAQLANAELRIDELTQERHELRALLRTTASLLLEACDAKTLLRFDADLLATIRTCARLRP
jgi:chromosome segregation ATPase